MQLEVYYYQIMQNRAGRRGGKDALLLEEGLEDACLMKSCNNQCCVHVHV